MKITENTCEKYVEIYSDYESGKTIKPCCEAAVFSFALDKKTNERYRLFVAGETENFYMWKDEPDGPLQYRTLTDSLSTETLSAHYSLDVSEAAPRTLEWRAYKRIAWKPRLSYLPLDPVGNRWRAGFTVKTENLAFEADGKLLMRVVVYLRTDGVDARSPLQNSREYVIELPETRGEWTTVTCEIEIPESETTFVGVWFEGKNYSGKVLIERPFLIGEADYNVLPDFSVPVTGSDKFDWTGQNLSKKERLVLEAKLNGVTVFDGEKIERVHRCSEWEIALPNETLAEKNTLEIRLKTHYHDAIPYTIREVGLIKTDGGRLAVVAVPKIVAVGGKAFALVRTANPGETVNVLFDETIFAGEKTVTFTESGLNVVSLAAKREATNAMFTLECGGEKTACTIGAVIARKPDGVIAGTGDMVYVGQTDEEIEEFFAWYVANNVGNLITVRPTYRWSGTTELNKEVWKKFVRLADGAGIKYSHMLDGRELPGIAANPAIGDLSGANFLGRQHHERDGAFVYWGRGRCGSATEEQYIDMCTRAYLEAPENVDGSSYSPETLVYARGAIWRNIDPELKRDYQAGAENLEKRLRKIREIDGATRHTGPAWLFSSFVRAGYSFVGAETMYSSFEPLMAALRGAKKCYGLKSVGVHHALQWCNSPLSTPESDRRFRLALYLSYILGADENNVEEGLWRIEEYYESFNRFSITCRNKTREQSDFYDYIRLNERKGELVAPAAFIQGKYDPFADFVNHQPWGFRGVPYGSAEKSWDLMTTIYPYCRPGDTIYRHRCPQDKPVGYFGGTPLGQIDVIPYETSADLLASYRVLAFLGYNRMDEPTARKLYDYAAAGGKVILTRAHLTTTTETAKVLAGEFGFERNALSFAIDPEARETVTVNGNSVAINPTTKPFDKVLVRADDGREVAGVYEVGEGEIVAFNTLCYPSDPAIRADYERVLREYASAANDAERVAVECGDDVEYAAYKTGENAYEVYVLAVDWYRDPDKIRSARLRIGERTHDFELTFGTMPKIVVRGDNFAYATSENAVVTEISDGEITVRGYGKTTVKGSVAGRYFELPADFAAYPTITLKP